MLKKSTRKRQTVKKGVQNNAWGVYICEPEKVGHRSMWSEVWITLDWYEEKRAMVELIIYYL